MKKISCYICEEKNAESYFTSGKTIYYKCQNCHLIFTDKLPITSYENWQRSQDYLKWQKYLENVFTRIVKEFSRYKSGGAVLDIGSSVGYMSQTLTNFGFKVTGVEPSSLAVKVAKEKGLNVKKGYFEKINFPKNYFDGIVANHVLEHIKDPNIFLKKCHMILKKDGVILISLPNMDSLEAQIFLGKWRFLMPKEHYSQFTPKTLRKLLEKNGFKIMEEKTTVTFSEFDNFWSELKWSISYDPKRFAYYIKEFIPSLLQLFLKKGTGLQIIAKKL
jgi:2-polyprenyl-3-methyl-5-hydroxy-6-metoxy-1,4-benzoquinol methylase